jgi:hypothetical protein
MSSSTSGSVLDDVLNMLLPHTAGAIAAPLGEPEEAVRAAMAAAVARVLASLADSTGKPAGFWQSILNLASNPANQGEGALASLSDGTPTAEQSDLGRRFLGVVLGGQQAPVADKLTVEAGLNAGSGARILSFAAPVVLAWLSQQIREQGLNAASLADLLGSDAPELYRIAPLTPPPVFKGVLPLWPILGVVFLTGVVWYVLQLQANP